VSVLRILKVKRSTIFCEDFENLESNNEIDFSAKNIAVIYAPNGVGKTSLAQVFNKEPQTEFEGTYEQQSELRGENGIFHVIHDQNGRNIIVGQAEDFVMGDNIRYERELRKLIDSAFKTLRETVLISQLKDRFGISKASSKLVDRVADAGIRAYIKELANSRSKGISIDIEEFINNISRLSYIDQEVEEDKIRFLIENSEGNNSIIAQIESITDAEFNRNERIQEVEENSDAIRLLSKYSHKQLCVVCDNDLNALELLDRKTINKSAILNLLDERLRTLIENMLSGLGGNDPFTIKQIMTEAILSGDITGLQTLQTEINRCFVVYSNGINNLFLEGLNETPLTEKWNEYQGLLTRQLTITDEDMQFIERMLNDNLDKHIVLKRDEESKEIKLLLNEKEFLGKDRPDLHLSTGEQNFVSLTFEFVKAKNLNKEIIVIDDPISSFDSIYKNKITYAIIKFLQMKKLIILTHNTDLIRLLEVQKKGCFQLYLFNNVCGETNGFIKVVEEEKDKIIYINKMLEFLRSDCPAEIVDEKLFLISLIPFMRGYAQFIGDRTVKNELTKIMHGYSTDAVELTNIYSTLFGTAKRFADVHRFSVDDILSINLDTLCILNQEHYPLLNKVLKHSLIYLYLRLSVEKVLVDKYGINTERYEQLGDIIMQAFREPVNQSRRIFFMSRKTLLNEFNHFEGNMNIIQPAIDISDTNLQKEQKSILDLLEEIRAE